MAELWTHILANPTYKVVITGHSLGGCMAIITAFFLTHRGQFTGVEYSLYTYGNPRVGNKGFVDYMNTLNITAVRVVARADFAPHFIPVSIASTNVIIGDYYLHTQTEYWINGTTGKFCNNSIYEDPTCSNSMGPIYSTLLDHLMYFDANYLTCIAEQPWPLISLPYTNQFTSALPPLPEFISGPIGQGADFIYGLLRGPFG